MLAGGAEACIDPVSMAGFCRLKALSSGFNDCPMLASRPFHKKRDGFVMAEGAAVLVLEEANHAIARGAPILCELRGYGLTGDAYHVTSPDPEGRGAMRAMTMALDQADILPEHVDYVNAHATSTPMGDDIEAKAIDTVLMGSSDMLRKRDKNLFVSSTKGATGHMLGAAGAIEAAISVMSIMSGTVPTNSNLNVDDVCNREVKFRYVTGTPIKADVNIVITNSFGFGGTNASLVFSKFYL